MIKNTSYSLARSIKFGLNMMFRVEILKDQDLGKQLPQLDKNLPSIKNEKAKIFYSIYYYYKIAFFKLDQFFLISTICINLIVINTSKCQKISWLKVYF